MTFRLQERNQNTFNLHCISSFFRGSPIWGTVCKYMQFLKYLFYSPTRIIRNQQFNSLNSLNTHSLLGFRSRIENKKQWRCKDKNRFTDLSEESSWMSPHIRSVVSGHSGEWWSLSFIKSSLDGKKICMSPIRVRVHFASLANFLTSAWWCSGESLKHNLGTQARLLQQGYRSVAVQSTQQGDKYQVHHVDCTGSNKTNNI